ncbi:MAG: hypothetical protein ACOX60_03415 [Massiliimalia sp.]|jgi:uridine kinase
MKYQKAMEPVLVSKLQQEFRRDPEALIRREEALYHAKIQNVCDEILASGAHIILLTGPSASGKTTTALQILQQLKEQGKKGCRISLDDFYKNNEDQPVWSDGRPNFESVESMDLDCFHNKIEELFQTGKSQFPMFDFSIGRRSEQTLSMTYDKETYLVFEGINALNPLLSQQLEGHRIVRIYVSVHSDFLDDHGDLVIKARNLRLMRRLLRDSVHRNSDALRILDLWKYVRMGEKLYIKPYRQLADIHINSTHRYEPFIYGERTRKLLLPLLDHPEYGELAQTILTGCESFESLSADYVPEHSLIQEFIR